MHHAQDVQWLGIRIEHSRPCGQLHRFRLELRRTSPRRTTPGDLCSHVPQHPPKRARDRVGLQHPSRFQEGRCGVEDDSSASGDGIFENCCLQRSAEQLAETCNNFHPIHNPMWPFRVSLPFYTPCSRTSIHLSGCPWRTPPPLDGGVRLQSARRRSRRSLERVTRSCGSPLAPGGSCAWADGCRSASRCTRRGSPRRLQECGSS